MEREAGWLQNLHAWPLSLQPVYTRASAHAHSLPRTCCPPQGSFAPWPTSPRKASLLSLAAMSSPFSEFPHFHKACVAMWHLSLCRPPLWALFSSGWTWAPSLDQKLFQASTRWGLLLLCPELRAGSSGSPALAHLPSDCSIQGQDAEPGSKRSFWSIQRSESIAHAHEKQDSCRMFWATLDIGSLPSIYSKFNTVSPGKICVHPGYHGTSSSTLAEM